MAELEEIRLHLVDELTPSAKERGKYLCPLCGSGSHGAGSTAAFSIEKDGIHGKCFACGFYGDIFDLVAQRDSLTQAEAARALIERYQPGAARLEGSAPYRAGKRRAGEAAQNGGRNYGQEIEKYHAALPGSAGEKYLMGRGLTAETLERFKMGYDGGHYFPGVGTLPAVVMPYDPKGHYMAWRSIGPEKHYDKPKADEAGEEPIFNGAALYSGEPVFVVESQLCAISVEQEGGKAVAIGGTGHNKLYRAIKKKSPAGVLILSMDNDEAGQEEQRKMAEALEAQGIPFIQANISGAAKDPNEALQQGTLHQSIADALQGVDEARKKAEAERLEQRRQESAAGYIDGFFAEIEKSKSTPAIKTGFPGLDGLLDGGLYPGLYIVGAITSLGKSTFCLQIADQVAAAGHDVLFFALEMSRQELMAKSLSRLTFALSRARGMSQDKAKTTRGILSGKKWSTYTREEVELIAAATDEYRAKISGNIWIYEGVGNIGVEQIRQEVEKHISITGKLPAVFVDYVQILAPVDMRASDKQNTDRNVLELKRLSRDKGIPVLCISSLNRDNYTSPINNAAFKESGSLEYGSDVLIGLQFYGMDFQEGEADKAREKRIRDLIREQKGRGNEGKAEEIQLKILKNRNGKSGTDKKFFYTPYFNHYEEESNFIQVDPEDNPFTKKKRV